MSEDFQISPEAQQMLMQIQTFQQQYQTIMMQKEALNAQKNEIDKALEELSKTDDGKEVYKAVGPILVKSGKKELETELKEKNETIELRLKNFDKQEEKIKEKIQELQEKMGSMLKK